MTDIEDIQATPFIPNPAITKCILKDILRMDPEHYSSADALTATLRKLAKKYKYLVSKRELGMVYRQLLKRDLPSYPYDDTLALQGLDSAIRRDDTLALQGLDSAFRRDDTLWHTLITKSVRSESGIVNVSVSLPPDRFSCKYNCHFCPNEPGMPRSYLSNEDVFKRALLVDFDTVKQVYNRFEVLEKNGHPIDKLEFRVLGGTFSCYDKSVADDFIRDLYYAANTYYEYACGESEESAIRPRGTIEEEQAINVTARVHVVGLGVETRPDEIDEKEIVRFRRYGVTRVELGVQHTDDTLLRRINRGHGVKHSKAAIKLLKDYGFKVEIHIMADLPGATPEGDMECYRQVLQGEDLIPDYMKDYPCLDVDFTKVKEWKAEGKWTPYSEATPDAADLKRVLIYRQSITPPWVRVNRIQRDFKEAKRGELGFTSTSIKTNLSQLVHKEAENEGIYCQCIRCCEVSTETYNKSDIQYITYPFMASGAQEYFITAEITRPRRNLLLGFARLRLGNALEDSVIPELQGSTALIRELHVYGRVKQVGNDVGGGAQHLGIGTNLLSIAEQITSKYQYEKMAIISGIGVRDYYRKRGYELRGTYMMKNIKLSTSHYIVFVSVLMIIYAIILNMILQNLN